MTDTCANCGASPAPEELRPPREWTDHLRTERDWRPDGTAVVPLCENCHPGADQLAAATRDLESFDEAAAAAIETDVEKFLDGLDLAALRDEA